MTNDREPRWTKINVRQPTDELREHGPSIGVGVAAMPFSEGDKVIKTLAQIDTGAGGTVISTRMASELKLDPVAQGEVREAGREAAIGYYANVRLFLPGTDIELEVVALASLHPPHEVLIGRDILANCRLFVDFVEGTTTMFIKSA